MNHMAAREAHNALIWSLFAGLLLLATAPVWGQALYGFNPTIDQLLEIAICRSRQVPDAAR